jgi:hypothetical protein
VRGKCKWVSFLGESGNRLGVSLRKNCRGGNGNALEQEIVSSLKSLRVNPSYTSRGAPSICPHSHGFFFCGARHFLAVDISCTSQS